MSLFKKKYSEHDVALLKAQLAQETLNSVDFKAAIQLHRQITAVNNSITLMKEIVKATGQEMIEAQGAIYKLNTDGTLFYKSNDSDGSTTYGNN